MTPDGTSDIEYRGETKPRVPRVGVLLTILCPGLGYMYVGQFLKGLTITLLFLLMLETAVVVFSILKFFPLLPFLVVVTAWLVFTGFVAHDVARKCREEDYLLKGYNHWTIYATVFVLSYLVPIYATVHFMSRYLVGFDRVESIAMVPTIHADDVVLVDKSAYRNRTPRRGDLVAFRRDGDSFVLRVVAVEGDVVRIEGETVIVNSEPLERAELTDLSSRVPLLEGEGDLLAMVETNHGSAYVISVSPKAYSAHSIPPRKLDDGELFVLADNRSQVSLRGRARIRDSRDFGPISIDEVTGEPLYIAWSSHDDGTRWARIGLRTQ